ncbi:hypothetical protein KR222_006903, partial [Zaprionus bogoriensis]
DVAIKDAILLTKVTEQAVQQAVEAKLPSNTEAHEQANEILDSLRKGLSICEQSLNTAEQIPAYRSCVATVRGLAMASVGELAGQLWATSGAARLGLFW